MIVAGMASIPERQGALITALFSLHHQVDEVALFLNGYLINPIDNSVFPKVKVYMYNGNMGDAGKFALMHEYKDEDYFFACDDDIIYPIDFIDKMMTSLEDNDNEVIIGCHGRVVSGKVKSYYNDTVLKVHFEKENKRDERVNIAAMNSACFKIGNFRLTLKDFPLKNMTDIFVAIKAQKMKMPVIIIKHPANWVRQNKIVDLKKSIYSTHKDKDHEQTRMINSIENWVIY